MQLQDLEQKLKDSGALPYLLSGGAGALAGGVLAGATERKGESKLGRLGRILGTGLASGLATAGAHKLVSSGLEQMNNALPASDVSPEQKLLTGGGTRATAVGGTLAGIARWRHLKDQKGWQALSAADEGLWGKNPDTASTLVKSKDYPKSTNPYHDFVKEHANPTSAPHIVNDLKHLGIDAESPGFMDKMLWKHSMKPSGPIRKTLMDFLLKHEGQIMHARNKVVPWVTKVTGRSLPGVAGRAAAIGGAAFYPEIADALAGPFKNTDNAPQ